jgi:hypothetical protein
MSDVSGSIWGSKPITARCVCCGSKFHTTEAFIRQVQLGKEESLCVGCNYKGNNGDDEYPPEQEDRDEDRRHGI